MNIEEIAISECNSGDVLATSIFNEKGVTLVAKDTVINEYIKERLIEQGIISVRIYDSFGNLENTSISHEELKKGYKDTLLQTKSVLHDLTAGRPLDFQKVSSISDQIHKNINEDNNIIRCLSEMRRADEYTYTHCINTAFYSMLIAKWLKLSDCEINKSIKSGLLHDIGKSRIPSKILCKNGILTREEYEVIKNHTILGYEIVKNIDEIDNDIKAVTLLHHERINGSGYPLNTSPDSINLFCRIVAVADVFDAMTSDRIYKKRMTPFQAFEMFQTVGMGMFDVGILGAFLKNLAIYLVGSKVTLSNGEIGEVVYVPLQNLTCPIIKVASGYLDFSKETNVHILDMI